MHIWTIDAWKNHLSNSCRTGLRLRFEQDVDPEVRRACICFARWLRKEYFFPLRIPIYVKKARRIETKDKDKVCGTFFEPVDYSMEPYIKIASGDYADLERKIGKDNALAAILLTISHELTHYFQWINNLKLTSKGRERQATYYSRYIVEEYSETREHP